MNPFILADITDGKLHYLAGPRTPEKVRRDGYGFTFDPAAAWPFHGEARAKEKARLVERHMAWPRGRLVIVNLNLNTVTP